MIILAVLAAIVAGMAFSLILAFPAGLFLMLLMSVLHDEVNVVVPNIGYWTAYKVSLFLAAFLIFLRPSASSSANN